MIKSIRDTETQKVWEGRFSKKLPQDIQAVARRRLRMLNNAVTLEDLRIPPANRLEALKDDRKGQNRIAREIGVPPRRINEICLRQRAISADTAVRLADYFGNSARFWLGLQMDFDLEEARTGSMRHSH